ncbi:hypothetical protein HUJ04_000913 [Dendroctonus ponderosae]|nr:hypothetical protein HUJ04_000913 [Dendroctonus ponderosae]KAH1018514.1 hypothetical protein HUJ05_006263 [Dendroctonus ponderosae]
MTLVRALCIVVLGYCVAALDSQEYNTGKALCIKRVYKQSITLMRKRWELLIFSMEYPVYHALFRFYSKRVSWIDFSKRVRQFSIES